MTVAFNIWEEAKRTTSKLMRYVTDTVIQRFFLTLLHCFSSAFPLVLISHTLSPSRSLFFPFSLSHINFDVASPCTVDGTWEPWVAPARLGWSVLWCVPSPPTMQNNEPSTPWVLWARLVCSLPGTQPCLPCSPSWCLLSVCASPQALRWARLTHRTVQVCAPALTSSTRWCVPAEAWLGFLRTSQPTPGTWTWWKTA